MNPLARKENIFVENLANEVILYDKTNNKVHCLSKPVAAVWEACDGTKSLDDLAPIVEAKSGAQWDRELVLRAVEELEKAGLLKTVNSVVSEAEVSSRREAVGKIAVAGSALVATLVAAAPAAHASVKDTPPEHKHKREHEPDGGHEDQRSSLPPKGR